MEVFMYPRILVPLDGSRHSEDVLPLVRILAGIYKTEVVLVSVVEYPSELYSQCYDYPPSDPSLAEGIQKRKMTFYLKAKTHLEQIASTLAEEGVKVTTDVCEGPVVESILGAARRHLIDLIVLSTCGQSGGPHWGMGAVADRMLREAPVPVILMRPTPYSLSTVSPLTRYTRLPL